MIRSLLYKGTTRLFVVFRFVLDLARIDSLEEIIMEIVKASEIVERPNSWNRS